MKQIDHSLVVGLGGSETINAMISEFRSALEKHSKSEGVAAPTANPLIEDIVFNFDGEFEVINIPDDIVKEIPKDLTDPVGTSLSMRQLRQGLRAFAGKPASFIQDTINTIPDASAKDDAQIWYEETTEVHWDHPATQTLIALAKFKPDDAAALWLKIAKEIPR